MNGWTFARVVAPLILASLAAAGPALAEDNGTDEWGTARGWEVRVDKTMGNGCFIVAGFEDGTVFRLGFDRTDDSAYLMFGNDDWSSIEADKHYDLEIQMDRADPWRAPSVGVEIDGTPFLFVPLDEADFIGEIMAKHTMAVDYDGTTVARLSLAGSTSAVAEMVSCQDAVDKGDDPFAN